MRVVAAKGMAVCTIAAVVAAAMLLRLPWRSLERPALSARVIPLGIVGSPRPGSSESLSHAHALPGTSVGESERPGPYAGPKRSRAPVPPSWSAALSPVWRAGLSGPPAIAPAVERAGGSIPSPAPLASRSIAILAEPRHVVARDRATVDAPRRGALTRAMGTTAGALRTAGTTVAGALKKVF